MIRRFLERRKLRKLLLPYIDQGAIEALVEAKPLPGDSDPFWEGPLGFVIAAVRGANPTEISARMGVVSDVAAEHGGTTDSLVSSVVIVVFGTLPAAHASHEARFPFLAALEDQLGRDVKAVHGFAEGHYGILGSGSQLSYSFIIPGFLKAFAALAELEFGQTIEVSASGPAA